MGSLKAGDLNRRITLQSRDEGEDEAGGPLLTWTTLATVWCSVRTPTGMGSIRNHANQDGIAVELNTYSFRIRYRTDVDAANRIVFDGQNYDVKLIKHDHANKEWTDLVAEVGGNDG